MATQDTIEDWDREAYLLSDMMAPGIAIFLLISIVFLIFLSKSPFLFAVFWASLCATQNLFLSLLLKYEVINPSSSQMILSLKEFGILLLFLKVLSDMYLGKVRFRLFLHEKLLILALAFIFVSSVVNNSGLPSTAIGIRQILIIPICFTLFYRYFMYNKISTAYLKVYPTLMLIVIFLFAAVELMSPDRTEFWYSIGYQEFIYAKNSEFLDGYLYGNMYFRQIGDFHLRLGLITFDPLVSAYLVTNLIFIIIFSRPNNFNSTKISNIFLASALSALVYLTFARGVILVVFSVPLLLAIKRLTAVKIHISTMIICGTLIAFVIGNQTSLLDSFSGKSHVIGLSTGIEKGMTNLFGAGPGSAGNLANNITTQEQELGDTYFGSTSFQIGFLGLLLVILIWINIIRAIDWREVGINENMLLSCVWCGILISSTLNESVVSLVSMSFLIVYSAYLASGRRNM